MISPNGWSRNDSPKFRKRLIPILTVGATEQLTATILAHSIVGYDTHWTKSGTRPHMQGDNLCQWCLLNAPKKWRGFLHVYHHAKKAEAFLELTDFAWGNLEKLIGKGKSCRGHVCMFHRERTTVKSPVVPVLLQTTPMCSDLPKPKDPTPTLMRVWGFEYTTGQQDVPAVN